MSGIKHDQGKAPLDLIPYEAQVEIAKVLAFGEKKYSAGNWAKGLSYRRLIAAAQRHIGEFNSGVDKDEESGLSHVAHAACCLMFLLYMEQKKPEQDDRWVLLKEDKPVKAPKPVITYAVGRRYKDEYGRILLCKLPGCTPGSFFMVPVGGAKANHHGLFYIQGEYGLSNLGDDRIVEELGE